MQIAAELLRTRTKKKISINDLLIKFKVNEPEQPKTEAEKKALVKTKKEIFKAYFPNLKVIKRKKGTTKT